MSLKNGKKLLFKCICLLVICNYFSCVDL
ncbi:hypothetical protein EG68_11677 [Paragonimus skrjabini miyazakii]|uniref:Uncharacterized protein n=1 Tax=Paragonimus skrjabini miyazakii TaxID=59628 RepID=A0A8S9YHX1_9TREM|nr:hypothetical protein EG68_11677 [Paragonimus skrjabini miyazakii]